VVDTLDLRKLDRVSFFGCFQVNRKTLDLISCCQEITSLDLSGCLLLRSEDMEFIISSFPNLKRIAIRDCTALNGHDVRVFLSKCPLLEKLDATGVPVRYNYELNVSELSSSFSLL
jgi:hypothetical protein